MLSVLTTKTGGITRKFLGVMTVSVALTTVMVSWACAYVQTHSIVSFKYVQGFFWYIYHISTKPF